MATSLAGSRIREARRRAGMTQAALAAHAGISPSYLNLIEHNRRRIGGRVLSGIAAALDVAPGDLSEDAAPHVVEDLQAAAAEHGLADPATAEAFAARFPEWAALAAQLARRVRDQDAAIAGLADRLTHDPFVAENVHAMLSHITAIRSTAGILASVQDVPALQQTRFHQTIDQESVRLSDTAQALADYLGKAATPGEAAATAEETLDQVLARRGRRFEAVDQEAAALSDLPPPVFEQRIAGLAEDIADAEPAAMTPAARRALIAHIRNYARDARAMPLARFAEEARGLSWDPVQLARRFDVPVPAVFRRLAVLARPMLDAPRFGLMVVTPSGYPLLRHPRPDFALPRHGNTCPRWPVFQGFARPGQLLLDRIEHDTGRPFVTLTWAAPRATPVLGAAPDLAAAMLFIPEIEAPFPPVPAAAVPVGTSCRICARDDCAARMQPRLLG